MNDNELTVRLKDNFDEMLVYKDVRENSFISSFKLPSFMRDWVVKRFQDEDGSVDSSEAADFIKEFIPNKKDWNDIKNKIIINGEHVKFLANISVDIDIKSQEVTFALPDFGLSNKETAIPRRVWDDCQDQLLKAEENWGIVELSYQYPDEKRKNGKIKLDSFRDFCPYSVDLDEYKYARENFSLDEWIDILLGAIDYNAAGYNHLSEKLAMITRLLPFVEKRLNMIELAPKGTGKSYVFGSLSRFGWLSSGGVMSRAKMFYDISRKSEGLVYGHDYVALDEVQTIKFSDINEMRGALKGYMENGKYTIGSHEGSADSGVILLGNIDQSNMSVYKDMFTELPDVFHESALLDRFHGFLKGWDLPRMNEDLKIKGWALNSEYFSSIMHQLRDEASYRAVADALIDVPEKADTRDTEAIKRISTAYLKLLFPNAERPEDIDPREFENYCLRPAVDMRAIIKLQLGLMDPDEFGGKSVPKLAVKGNYR